MTEKTIRVYFNRNLIAIDVLNASSLQKLLPATENCGIPVDAYILVVGAP